MKRRYKPLKQIIRENYIFVSIMLIIIIALLILALNKYLTSKSLGYTPLKEFDEAYGTAIVEELIPFPSDSESRPGTLRIIKYIVIHETGNYSSSADAQRHSSYLLKMKDSNSWHYTVDEGVIYRHIPDNEIAWHAGTREGNEYGIGIELCVNEGNDFEETLHNGAKLVAKLLKEYRLDTSAIKQHYDFSGKNCPYTIRSEGRMDEFIDLVKYYLEK